MARGWPARDIMEHIRRIILRPYRTGMGPVVTLDMFDTFTYDRRGCTRIAYRLHSKEGGRSRLIFEGSDFCASPLHAADSDESAHDLLMFLTLRPGDTDADYFAEYTAEQVEWAEKYGEQFACEAADRLDPDSCY